MKKVAIVSPMILPVPDVNGGAVEKLITQIIEQNEKRGDIQFDLYTIYDNKIVNKYKYTNIIQIKDNRFIKIIGKIVRKLFGVDKFLGLQYGNLKRKFSRNHYDSVIVENNMLVYLCLYNENTDFYFHLHNDLVHKDKTLKIYKKIASTCKKMIVVSDFLKNKLLKQFYTENVEVLENGIDIINIKNTPYLSIEEIKKFKDNSFIYGYVGRIAKEKGVLELLKAFNKNKNPNDKLLLICPDFTKENKSLYEKELYKYYKKNRNRIFITGYIDNSIIGSYYNYIDCLIIPTIVDEAFGMVALEGLIYGKRIIASKSGELPNLLKNTSSIILSKDNFLKQLIEILNSEYMKKIKFNIDSNFLDKYKIENFYLNFMNIIDL